MSDIQVSKYKIPLRDAAIVAGWVAGLVVIAALIWFFTQPLRDRLILNAVNHVLEQSGDSRRLEAPIPSGALNAGQSRMGFWYTVSGLPHGSKAFVFTFVAEGTFFPGAALVSPAGTIEEFIPLSNHAERMLRRISPEILKLYGRRIVGGEL